jgi:hypothetical protein
LSGPTGPSINRQSVSDGGQRNSAPGRSRHKPINHCAGKAGCSGTCGPPCASCAHDCGCHGHPAFPAPSAFERANADRITSGAPRREIAMSYPSPAARRIGPGSELEQYRAFFQAAPGPAHSCDPTAVPGRWTASKQWENARFFAGLAAPQLRRRASPNYTPSAPKLRLIATQVSDQIGSVKSRVALRRRGCVCRTVP